MKLIALPAFADNYIWMLHDGSNAIVVDPGQDAPVHAALDQYSLQLAGILVTHHHADHVGGVDALRGRLQGTVHGPRREQIPQPCIPLDEGDHVTLLGCTFEVIDVPGHTAGHIAFVHRPTAQEPGIGAPILFCGDTLFSGGCGRLFEGTAAQMNHSLGKLEALPADTRVCCAHEYTLSNLKFATAVEPANEALRSYVASCERQRADGQPTLPSTIAVEKQINPFLRCHEPDVIAAARRHGASSTADDTEVFAALRQWKNEFR